MLDVTAYQDALKIIYSKESVENMTYADHPFFAMLKKNEKFGGKSLTIDLIYGNPQGRSADFSKAKTLAAAANGNALVTAFELTRASDYSVVQIGAEVIEASKGNENALIEALTTQIDGSIASLTSSIGTKLFRDSSGYIAQVLAEPDVAASTVITLVNVEDIVHFEIGQVVVLYAAKSGGSVKTFNGTIASGAISAVNRVSGSITIATAYTSSGDIAANDYIFIDGDRGVSLSGLESWIPASAPSSALFFGVDRSVDPTRLGGLRLTASATGTYQAAISQAASLCAREGGSPDMCFMSYHDFEQFNQQLGIKVNFVDVKVNAEVGFRGIKVNGPKGAITVIPDQDCPDGIAYVLTMKTWTLHSLGKAVRQANPSQMLMELEGSLAFEARHVFWGNLACNAPGYNCRVVLPTTEI